MDSGALDQKTSPVKPSIHITMGNRNQGFTRAELLLVIAVIGVLALTQIAGFARNGGISKAALCQNNLSQLTRAWQLYSEDNDGKLPYNPSSSTIPAEQSPLWAGGGWLDFNGSTLSNVDSALTIKKGALWSYTTQSPSVWRCPTDTSTANYRGNNFLRVRSYSMNNWINGTPWTDRTIGTWTVFTNLTDFNSLAPAQTFLLMDEHPGGINDNMFFVSMGGYGRGTRDLYMIDFPSSGHAGGAGVSFVDGHVELKRWQDSRTQVPFTNRVSIMLNLMSPSNPDVSWLQERATRQLN